VTISSPKLLATSAIFKKLPKANKHPKFNLVTLLGMFLFHKCRRSAMQGRQMSYFRTKKRNLGKFWRVLQLKMLVCFMGIWYILRPFDLFFGHLVDFVLIWYIFPPLVYCAKKNLAILVRCGIHSKTEKAPFPV
jgi:hypothetical protein